LPRARKDFAAVAPDPVRIAVQHQAARRIMEIAPNDVYIVAQPEQRGCRLDGQKVWHTLHALGVRWGDCDQFQWRDPTDQTDYRRARLCVARGDRRGTPAFSERAVWIRHRAHPAHVLHEMARAAECFAKQLNCQLVGMIDGEVVDGLHALEAAVSEVAEKLQACGVKPGSSPVCRLR
jgi:hypothetical protein